MTNMEHALTAAGVKLPSQKQRIWQWLRDKGPHSVKDLHVELKIGEPTVQAAVTDLIKRKMLRTLPRTDHKGTRLNNHYEALGRAFELLPLPMRRGAAGRAAAAAKREEKVQQPDRNARSGVAYATIALRVPQSVQRAYEAHAKEYGVTLSDIWRLALEAYAKKMRIDVPVVDPLDELRARLEGDV